MMKYSGTLAAIPLLSCLLFPRQTTAWALPSSCAGARVCDTSTSTTEVDARNGGQAAAKAILPDTKNEDPGAQKDPSPRDVPHSNGTVIAGPDNSLPAMVRPEDFCPDAGSGITDATPCWNRAISFLASAYSNAAIKTLTATWSTGGYFFGSTNYLINLPRDFGDYHGAAGYLTPAAVSLSFANGELVSCSVTGGSSYAPDAQLPVQIIDPSYTGTGANANVATNRIGVPTGCTVTTPGMRYPRFGVTANVIPLGGDGAAGTIDLVAGAITNPRLTSHGYGYATGLAAAPLGLSRCAYPYPSLETTVVNAEVSSFSVKSGGSSCQYRGSSDAVGIPVAFGASCGGVQCTLLTPEAPRQQACSVALRNGVNIQGIGNPTITTGYVALDGSKVSLTQPVAFCDPFGDQALVSPTTAVAPTSSSSMQISGITVNAFIDFWFSGEVQAVKFDAMTFLGGVPLYAASIDRNQNFTSGATFTSTSIRQSVLTGFSGPICAGGWDSRNPSSGAGGVLGGTIFLHPSILTPAYWGTCANIAMEDDNISLAPSSVAYRAGVDVDTFFEKNVWKTQNGPTASAHPALITPLSNGGGQCPSTQAIVDRTTDFAFGEPYQSRLRGEYPYQMCYTGYNGMGISATPRYWRGVSDGNGIDIRHVNVISASRPVLSGTFGNINIFDLYTDNGQGTPPADPYLPVGSTRHAISIFGPPTITGNVDLITIVRGVYDDGLQVRQLGSVSPFVHGLNVHNTARIPDQSYPEPFYTPPTSTSPCYIGQRAHDLVYEYQCVDKNQWKRIAWTTF
jgi:hypothetical protein